MADEEKKVPTGNEPGKVKITTDDVNAVAALSKMNTKDALRAIKSHKALWDAITKRSTKPIKMFGKQTVHEKKDDLKIFRNPAFWKSALNVGTLVAAMNDPEYWGGDSNKATCPMGMYMPQSEELSQACVNNIGILSAAKFDDVMEFDLVSNDFEQALANFDLKYGFETGLTMTDITHAIAAGIKFCAVFTWAKKMYNCRNVLLVDAETAGRSLHMSDLYDNLHGYDFTYETSRVNIKQYKNIHVKYDNINNTTWLSDYVSKVQRVYLLPHHKAIIQYLFEGFFSNGIDAAVNSVIDVVPFDIDEEIVRKDTNEYEISIKKVLDAALSDYEAAISANRYIRAFLEILGYKAQYFGDMLQRDPQNDAYVLKLDEEFLTAIENINCFITDDEDHAIVYQHNVDVDFTVDDQIVEIPVGAIGELLKLRWLGAKWVAYSALTLDQEFIDDLAVRPNYMKIIHVQFRNPDDESEDWAGVWNGKDPWNKANYSPEPTAGQFSAFTSAMHDGSFWNDVINDNDDSIYQAITNLLRDPLADGMSMAEFLGIVDTNTNRTVVNTYFTADTGGGEDSSAPYVDGFSNFGSNDTIQVIENIGVDAAYIPTYYMYASLAKISFTWGHNYKADLDKFSADVTELKLVK